MPFFSRRKTRRPAPIYWKRSPDEPTTRLHWDTPLPWIAFPGGGVLQWVPLVPDSDLTTRFRRQRRCANS